MNHPNRSLQTAIYNTFHWVMRRKPVTEKKCDSECNRIVAHVTLKSNRAKSRQDPKRYRAISTSGRQVYFAQQKAPGTFYVLEWLRSQWSMYIPRWEAHLLLMGISGMGEMRVALHWQSRSASPETREIFGGLETRKSRIPFYVFWLI